MWHGSIRLEKATERLAIHYRLPPVVQGAVLAAIGSSFPELAGTVLSTVLHGEFELGVSVVVGSAIFNILVIPGITGISSGSLHASRRFLYKDALFYISSVLVILLAFSLAVIYNPGTHAALGGVIDRRIAILPVLLYMLYLFVQQQDTQEQREQRLEESSIRARPKDDFTRPLKVWATLVYSLVVIVIGVEILVRSAIAFGDIFDTPSFLWGLTIVAAVTSLPDAFISVRAAHQGSDTISLANVFGSNIFDLLIAIPAGVFIAGQARIDFGVAAPLLGFLGLATIVLFTVLRTDLRLSVRESYGLIILYVVFIVAMILEQFRVTNWIR